MNLILLIALVMLAAFLLMMLVEAILICLAAEAEPPQLRDLVGATPAAPAATAVPAAVEVEAPPFDQTAG